GLRGERYHLGYAVLDASGDHHQRSIQLRSEAVDASLTGQIDFNSISSSFRSYAGRLLPSLYLDGLTNQQESLHQDERQNFQLDIHTKVFDLVAALISPKLMIGDSSVFKGKFDFAALSSSHSGDTLTTFVLDMPLFRWGTAE